VARAPARRPLTSVGSRLQGPPGICYPVTTMYAIIETGGKQYWVIPGEVLQIERIEAKNGQEVTFNALWAVADAKNGGEPETSQKAKVVAEILGERRGPRIIVFKKRTKKAYKKRRGHRQDLVDIRIKAISFN